MTVSFTIIIPTAGRATLTRTIGSVTPQLEPGDELLILRRDCEYGNESRDDAMRRAAGTHLLFIDDDDEHTPDALEVIRGRVQPDPDRVHVFKMRFRDGLILWTDEEMRAGNVGTPMVCVPNQPGRLGVWANADGHLSDFGFLAATMRLRGDQAVFHDELVALVRPE